jgi:hypothetical protein
MHSGGGGHVQYKSDWPLTSVSLSSEKYSMISHGLAQSLGQLPPQDAYARTPGRVRRLAGGRRRASRLSTTYR